MKYALITGGSRGIGRAICIAIAQSSDYGILINYNSNEDAALSTKREVEKQGNKAELLPFDVTTKTKVDGILEEWYKTHPDDEIEVLINNAGITKDGLFMWMSEEDWSNVIDTSLKGFFNSTQFLIPKMLRKKYGRIVTIASVSGLKGMAGQTNYSAAKGAVIAATKALAQEVAKRNVTVNAIAPGMIKTDMTKGMDDKELSKYIPAKRFGEPEEVAALVTFLISKNASYITGEVINVNGGIYS